MNRSSTAREALIAELLGEVADLLKRVESLKMAMDRAQEGMTDAASLLDSRVEPFRVRLAAELEQTKNIAVKAFIHQTNQVALLEQGKQREAMAESARAVVDKEIAQPLRQFASTLRALVERANRPWESLLLHAANTVTTAACSGLLVLSFLGR